MPVGAAAHAGSPATRQDVLNPGHRGADAQQMTPRPPATTVTVGHAPGTWPAFTERFGITAACGLMAAIVATCQGVNAGLTTPEPLTVARLYLVLVMLGCIAVLSYRTVAPRPPT